MLTADQIQDNWDKFFKFVQSNISGERGEKLSRFFDLYADRLALMPASGKTAFHNAFPGGYIDHVLRVVSLSFSIAELWEMSGASVPTREEIAFVAICHDLGKFGDFDNEEYLVQDQDWARKRGEEYKHNPDINFMKTSERSLFLLQALGIQVSQDEYLGIKLHDGLYEEANKSYYISYSEEYRLRSNLAYIVHQADLLATRIEFDNFHNPKPKVEIKSPKIFTSPILEKHTSDGYVESAPLKKEHMKQEPVSKVVSTIVPGVDMSQVIPSLPHIVKENSSKPVKVQGKYAKMLNKL